MSAKKGLKGAELCRTLDIQPYVLRYWETEFKGLQPASTSGGQRVYGDTEVLLVRRIKQLLYDEGYTIAGARKKLESEPLDSGEAGANAELFESSEGESRPEAPAAAPQKPAKRGSRSTEPKSGRSRPSADGAGEPQRDEGSAEEGRFEATLGFERVSEIDPADSSSADAAPDRVESASDSDGETPNPLDTVSAERIKQLRSGIETAIADARSVLSILDKHPR